MKFHALDVMHEVCKRAIRGVDSAGESMIRRNPAATSMRENAAIESARHSSDENESPQLRRCDYRQHRCARLVRARINGHVESCGMRSTRRACSRDDVAFTPGKTMDGRDVAPADLDQGPRPQLPDVIPILITTEFGDHYGVPFGSPLFEADAVIGLVT
jgi:hypothetical protein